MKDDSLLDIDSFMKQMKLGSGTFRSRSPSKKQSETTRFAVSQHLRTVDAPSTSPGKTLRSKLERFQSEYGDVSLRSSSRRQSSNGKSHKSIPALNNQDSKKSGIAAKPSIILPLTTELESRDRKQFWTEGEAQQFKGSDKFKFEKEKSSSQLHEKVKVKPQDEIIIKPQNQISQIINPKRQSFEAPKNKKQLLNKLESKTFLQQMQHLISTESSSISYRINQFTVRIRQQIQRQYERFKQIMIGFVQDFFMISKSAFVLSFEKKSVELNASFYVVQEELLQMSEKLKALSQKNHRSQYNLYQEKNQMDEVKINKQVEELVEKSMRLESKKPHVELNKDQLVVLEKSFKLLLAPRS